MPEDFVASAYCMREIHLQLRFHLLWLFALYSGETEPGKN